MVEPVARAEDEAPARRICPMDVPDTSVFLLELKGDATGLAFVTPGRVDELRARVRAMANLQNLSSAVDRVTASIEVIEGGAILALDPASSGGPDELQNDALAYAERLAGGDCPMTRDRSAVLPARKSRTVPAQAPLAVSPVPGAGTATGVSSFITSMPTGMAGF
jgi:hypothetical protein